MFDCKTTDEGSRQENTGLVNIPLLVPQVLRRYKDQLNTCQMNHKEFCKGKIKVLSFTPCF